MVADTGWGGEEVKRKGRVRRGGGGASGRTGMMNRNDKAGCVRKGCWRLGGMNCVRQPGGLVVYRQEKEGGRAQR